MAHDVHRMAAGWPARAKCRHAGICRACVRPIGEPVRICTNAVNHLAAASPLLPTIEFRSVVPERALDRRAPDAIHRSTRRMPAMTPDTPGTHRRASRPPSGHVGKLKWRRSPTAADAPTRSARHPIEAQAAQVVTTVDKDRSDGGYFPYDAHRPAASRRDLFASAEHDPGHGPSETHHPFESFDAVSRRADSSIHCSRGLSVLSAAAGRTGVQQ